MSASLLLYGLNYFIPDHHKGLFIGCNIVTRLVEGGGSGVATSALISLVANNYPNQLTLAQSFRFLGSYSGSTFGVVAGAFLRGPLGYFGVFLTFSVVLLLTTFFIFVFEEDRSEQQIEQLSLIHFDVFKVRLVFLVIVCCFLTDFLQFSLDAILVIKLRTDFNYSTSTIGLFVGIFLGGNLILSFISLSFPEKWGKRILVIIILWINILAALLISPSYLLHLPNSPILIAIGLFFGGTTLCLAGVYIIVEGIRGGIQQFPEHEVRVSDVISNLYLMEPEQHVELLEVHSMKQLGSS